MGVKKGIHHIKHTRPQWYQDYHNWQPHAALHWTAFTVSSLIILMGFVNIIFQTSQNLQVQNVHAASSSTTLTQAVNAGSLTISNTGNQSLTAANVSTSSQNTTGSLGTITVTDSRGTGVGWSATATSTHFTKVNSAVLASGSNNTVTTNATSTYTDNTAGTYTITIATGGSVGTATFDVSGLETASNVTTASSGVAVGTKGVKVDFGTATYVTGDSWTIRVDLIPVTGLRLTPGSLTTISGASTNVTAGSQVTFPDTTTQETLVGASSNYGMGSYSVAPSLQLTVPANSFANSYTATVTETVQ